MIARPHLRSVDEFVAMCRAAAQGAIVDGRVEAVGCFSRVGVLARSQREGRRLAPGFPPNVLIAVTGAHLVCLAYRPGRQYRITGVVARWDRRTVAVHRDGDGRRISIAGAAGGPVELESTHAGMGAFDRANDAFFAALGQPLPVEHAATGDGAMPVAPGRSRRRAVTAPCVLALFGAAALLAGCFPTWAVVRSATGSTSIGGLHRLTGDERGGGGGFVLKDAVVALVVLSLGIAFRTRAVLVAGAAAAMVGLAFAVHAAATLADVFVPAAGVDVPAGADVSVGVGLWLCIAGGAVTVVAALCAALLAGRPHSPGSHG